MERKIKPAVCNLPNYGHASRASARGEAIGSLFADERRAEEKDLFCLNDRAPIEQPTAFCLRRRRRHTGAC